MATDKNLASASNAELRAVLVDFGLSHVGINAGHPMFGLVGNGVADDTTAIQAATTAARAANLPLILPPGKTISYTDTIVADWDNAAIHGYGTTTLKPTAAAGVGVYIGGDTGPVRRVGFSGFRIEGTGDFGDELTLIQCHATGGKLITLENIDLWYGAKGLHTTLTDYLQMRRVWMRGSEINWHAGQNTNATTCIACPIGGLASNGTSSVTDKHIWCDGIAGLEMIGCEFGDGDYGLYVPSGGNDNRNIALRGHRAERVLVSDVVWGTGTTLPPWQLVLDNVEFVASAGETGRPLVVANGGFGLTVRNCMGTQTGADHVLVKAQSASSKVHIEDSWIHFGHLFENAVGGFEDTRQIVYGW